MGAVWSWKDVAKATAQAEAAAEPAGDGAAAAPGTRSAGADFCGTEPAAATEGNRSARRTCQWPEGDPRKPGFRLCGGEAVEDKPYCASHCARAYRPVRPEHVQGVGHV